MDLNNELRKRQRKAYEQLLKGLEEKNREYNNKNKSNSHDCFKNMFNITSEPIIINLKDILEMLKSENPKTQQEKTITEVEKENKKLTIDDLLKLTEEECLAIARKMQEEYQNNIYEYHKELRKEYKDGDKISIKKLHEEIDKFKEQNEQENKTLKQQDDERLSHKGKSCKVINHKQIIHNTEGIIVDVNLDLQKYLVSMGQDDEAFAQWFLFDNVEVVENEWEDILIKGEHECEFQQYEILIKQEKIQVIGYTDLDSFDENKYEKIITKKDIVNRVVNQIKDNKQMVIEYLLNKLAKEIIKDEISDIDNEIENLVNRKDFLSSELDEVKHIINTFEEVSNE